YPIEYGQTQPGPFARPQNHVLYTETTDTKIFWTAQNREARTGRGVGMQGPRRQLRLIVPKIELPLYRRHEHPNRVQSPQSDQGAEHRQGRLHPAQVRHRLRIVECPEIETASDASPADRGRYLSIQFWHSVTSIVVDSTRRL